MKKKGPIFGWPFWDFLRKKKRRLAGHGSNRWKKKRKKSFFFFFDFGYQGLRVVSKKKFFLVEKEGVRSE